MALAETVTCCVLGRGRTRARTGGLAGRKAHGVGARGKVGNKGTGMELNKGKEEDDTGKGGRQGRRVRLKEQRHGE